MRGATHAKVRDIIVDGISIHAPHARSDVRIGQAHPLHRISIHAPHARSDAGRTCGFVAPAHFNPRSSCEERLRRSVVALRSMYFNPRSSCEERLSAAMSSRLRPYFNPRSSCEERPRCRGRAQAGADFNPRSSCEERRICTASAKASTHFNPRSSCEERQCHFQALICLTSSYIFREPSTSFRKHFF